MQNFCLAVLFLIFLLAACGEDSYDKVVVKKPAPETPVPTSQTPTTPESPTPPAQNAKALAVASIQAVCTSCHNGVVQAPSLKSEGAIDANKARICLRVGNGSMPPGGGIKANDKDAILKGLGC